MTTEERTLVANDNRQASVRVDPNDAYGPNTGISGHVWRNAFGGDYVCVSTLQRSRVQKDNGLALSRVVAF